MQTYMGIVGRVDSLWRYPVKSMRGEELLQAFVGFAGIYGDRIYAVHDAAAPAGFPYLTARQQQQMLLYRPVFRNDMTHPLNMAEAEALSPGITKVYASQPELEVHLPGGETYSIEDPALLMKLREGLNDRHELRLLRSDRALTDCAPVSLFSLQSAQELTRGKRCFRANVYLDLNSDRAFQEDEFVGRQVRIGEAVLYVLKRDSRCKMITLDPDTGEADPEILKRLARERDTKAGVYAAVLVEGIIRKGDEVVLADR